MFTAGNKESAPAVHIPMLRSSLPQVNPYNEILTNGYALTDVPSPFVIHYTLSIVIGRDIRATNHFRIRYNIFFDPRCQSAIQPLGCYAGAKIQKN